MTSDLPPEDNEEDPALRKVIEKTQPDASDRLEETEADKAKAETDLVQEAVEGARTKRTLIQTVIKAYLWITGINYLVALALTVAAGVTRLNFHVEGRVLIAIWTWPVATAAVGAFAKLVSSLGQR